MVEIKDIPYKFSMGRLYKKLKITTLVFIFGLIGLGANAQCPGVYDFYGQVVDNPYWYSCSGNDYTLNLSPAGNWGEFTIDWGDGSAPSTGMSWSAPTFQSHFYAASVDTFNIIITEVNTGCVVSGVLVTEESTSSSIQIPVGGLTQACAPQMMEFINSSTNVSSTTTFVWDFGDGSPLLTFDYTNWQQTIQHTYEIGTVTCETEVSLTSSNYCNVVQGGSSEATFNPIRIWDLDDPSITASVMVLCYPDTTVTFNNTTYRNCLFQGNIYQRYEYWNFGDYWNLGHDSIIDWTPWPPTFPHTMHYPGIGSYTVELLDSNYCGIAPTSITIQIVPPPVADIAASKDTICVGESVTFYQLATGEANSFSWNMGNGFGWFPTSGGDINYVFNTAGTFTVSSRVAVSGASGACSDVATVQIVVLPAPEVEIMADLIEGCDSLTVDYSQVSQDVEEWEWIFDVPPGTYSGQDPAPIYYGSTGSYQTILNVTGFNGCLSSDSETINVYSTPVVDLSVINLCEGDTAQFLDLTTISNNDSIVAWNWNFGDGQTALDQNPFHLYNGVGTFLVDLTVQGLNCTASDSLTVLVQAAPIASINQDLSIGCSPLQVQFGNTSTDAVTYQWDFGDGATSTDFETGHEFTNSTSSDTTFRVLMTATNAFGCGRSDSLFVTVHPSAVAAFDDSSNPPGCSPFDAVFYNTSFNATSYFWDLGDGATSNLVNPSHLYVNDSGVLDTYDITLYANNVNGCNDQVTHTIVVYPLAQFDFAISGSDGCAPLTVTMPFITGAQVFNWDFGDGSTSTFALPTHTFDNNTNADVTYDVTLIGSSGFGCSDTASTQVIVHPAPLAQFSASIVSGCSPLVVDFSNLSINADSFLWDYDDGSTSTTNALDHNRTFTNNSNVVQTYHVILSALTNNGCGSQFSLDIEVFPGIDAAFTAPGEQCSPITLNFSSSSTNASSFEWDFGNGLQSATANASTFYSNNTSSPIVFDVGLQVTSIYGCTDSVFHSVTVNPSPTVMFTPDVITGCSPVLVSINNTTTNADSYNWSFGDGQTSSESGTMVQHEYINGTSATQSYILLLNASNEYGCTGQYSSTIQVHPNVEASFVAPAPQCSPATMFFDNNSTGSIASAWDFGNGQQSAQVDPTNYFVNLSDTAATYNVNLTVTSSFGCTDSESHQVIIYPSPVVSFTPGLLTSCSPVVMNFNNTTTNADSFNWTFGDGQTSNDSGSMIQHEYVNSTLSTQTYNILLNASNIYGCTGQYTTAIQVHPHVQALFEAPDPQCSPANVFFNNISIGAVSSAWDFGNGQQSSVVDPTNYFVNLSDSTAIYNVNLTVTSSFGCTDNISAQLVVHASPVADFGINLSAACTPEPLEITNNSTLADSYSWNYGDGNTSTNSDPVHVHEFGNLQNGQSSFNILLVASSIEGCIDTASAVFTIFPDLVADFEVDTIGCSPFNAVFINQSQDAISYEWTFGDGQFSGQTNPLHQYTTDNENDQNFTAMLVATNEFGCTDTSYRSIQIMHTPVAVALMDSVYGCYPTNAILGNQSLGADNYQWVYGTGQTSQTDAASHTYTYFNFTDNVITYNITLHATTDYGCTSSDNLTIDVAPEITADFYIDAEGCTPLQTYFDNTSDGGNTYLWDFGDGDMSGDYEPSHTFFNWGNNDTTYTISLVLMDNFGCSDTAYSFVEVYPVPQAGFTVTPQTQTWPAATFTIDNTTTGGSLTYQWDMDDGTDLYVAEPGSYTYSTWGEYNIELIVGNGACGDTIIQTVEVIPPAPVALFEGPAEGCAPLTVQFTNLSEYAVSSLWNFGDGGIANATNPVYTYWQAGTYSVTLTVTGPDGSTQQITLENIIHVNPAAIAIFTVTPNEVNIPDQPVYCLNLSQNANQYEWSFGDGETSTESNPVHYYQEEGEYDVQLIANNMYNCPDTIVLPGIVKAKNSGIMNFPNAFTPNNVSANGGYYDAMSYDNDVFFPEHVGVTEYHLQIFNKWGELLFESKDVNRGWDGYYRGQLAKQDVYVWKVRARFVDGQQMVKAGDVTLLVK